MKWLRSFGDVVRVGVEGTGSYGAGICRHLTDADIETQKTLRGAIAEIEHLEFRPGERWSYSNPNYHLLAAVVERRSGQSFGTFLHERIFEPLHLNVTIGYETPVPGKAISYKYDNLNRPQVADVRWDAVGSGVQTTPSQLVAWADNYCSGLVGGAALRRDQLAGAVSTTLGQSNPPNPRSTAPASCDSAMAASGMAAPTAVSILGSESPKTDVQRCP